MRRDSQLAIVNFVSQEKSESTSLSDAVLQMSAAEKRTHLADGMIVDGTGPIDNESGTCGPQVDTPVLFATSGHPFHHLLPPRHPMPPCLDTLPPALGAPHN